MAARVTTEGGEHTAGPWRVGDSYTMPDGWTFVLGQTHLAGDMTPIVAKVQWQTDARLIAAAPELLAALRELVALIAAEYPQQQHVWLEAARAAIAKAKGKVPA